MRSSNRTQKYVSSAASIREKEAIAAYRRMKPLFQDLLQQGIPQLQMSEELNNLGYRTREGCLWSQVQVGRVIKYLFPE